ncbi:MAG: hypothetical protein NBV68_15595 [Erythrobacter sp.]|uniref:hypothetical protein n=1 Tax=Erythrobacter sp. TaxID=1042 RepID=UPI0025F957A1|nr:hypothetical protein [Erythrobacter sp.]MCM0000802.1 hypothetical protein [Erythrobacter sp.]
MRRTGTLALAIGLALLGGPALPADPPPRAALAQAASQQADVSASEASEPGYTGALDDDCSHDGTRKDGLEVFIAYCPREARSPDAQLRIVHLGVRPEEDDGREVFSDYVFIEDADGRRIGPMPGLSDAMPFALQWSPRAGRIFVTHHIGSFMGTPEVYDVTASGVVRQDAFKLAAVDAAIAAFPCLARYRGLDLATGGIAGWSDDGRYLAWVLETRTDMCLWPDQTGAVPPDLRVQPMLMISDLDTGAIVPESLRVLASDQAEGFKLPRDGPYQRITQGRP